MYVLNCNAGLEGLWKAKVIAPGRLLFKSLPKDISSFNQISRYITKFDFNNLEDIINKIKKINFRLISPFLVRCNKQFRDDLSVLDIEKKVGEVLFNKGLKVDLTNPKTKVIVDIINDICIISLAIKENLCKRHYYIRRNNQGTNPCIAASLITLSGWKKNESILDPFSKDGTILIEAYNKGSRKLIGWDDNKNNIKNAKINAKLAKTSIDFHFENIEWLDTRFHEDEIDYIITAVPYPSKRNDREEITTMYRKFLDQAFYIAKKKLIILTPKPQYIKSVVTKKPKEIIFKQGQSISYILVYKI